MTDSLITQQETEVNIDPNKNYLEDLVGENKKFKTAEDLAKGKFYADQTVELMKRRLDEMREDNLKLRQENVTKAKLEELIDKLSTTQSASNEHTPVNENNQPTFKTEDIETLFSKKYQEIKAQEKSEENFNIVRKKLQEQFGEHYASVLKQKSTELGLPIEDIDSLARKSPAAFFKTLGLEEQRRDSFTSPPRSLQRQDNFAPSGKQKRTWSYYKELKQKNPELWYDPKIAVQMQQDAIELGEDFRDGDYYVPRLHEK